MCYPSISPSHSISDLCGRKEWHSLKKASCPTILFLSATPLARRSGDIVAGSVPEEPF